MLKVRGVPVSTLARVGALYARRRAFTPSGHLARLLKAASGRVELTEEELRTARGADGLLRRLGVRCLWRAATVTELLRRRGLSARIRLFVDPDHPGNAHAECQVGDGFVRVPPAWMATLAE